MQVEMPNPRDTAGWMAYIEALYPGKVELTQATDAERRRFNGLVKLHSMRPVVKRHVALSRPQTATLTQFPTGRTTRPRERRERHVARSTSGADSGDDPPLGAAPHVADLRDIHDRVRIIRRDVASAKALTGSHSLAGVRLVGALDVIDDLLADLERFGVAV